MHDMSFSDFFLNSGLAIGVKSAVNYGLFIHGVVREIGALNLVAVANLLDV